MYTTTQTQTQTHTTKRYLQLCVKLFGDQILFGKQFGEPLLFGLFKLKLLARVCIEFDALSGHIIHLFGKRLLCLPQ